jgi:hypothetical protein
VILKGIVGSDEWRVASAAGGTVSVKGRVFLNTEVAENAEEEAEGEGREADTLVRSFRLRSEQAG